jgi:hypothetical protein
MNDADKLKIDIETIVTILEDSDIVWTRYGTETMQELALKILKAIKE